jgi:hypothetical protein
VTLAISFCRMPSHAILLLLIRAEVPALTAEVRRNYSHVPPLSRPIAEWISGLNDHDRGLIGAVFELDRFRLVLAEDGSGRSRIFGDDGRVHDGALPEGVCEFHHEMSADLKRALNDRWRVLLAHDASLPRSRKDFKRAIGMELTKVLPTERDPILPPGK